MEYTDLFVRNTNNWYLDKDPEQLVNQPILSFLVNHSGNEVLDYGCAVGGYAARMMKAGFRVKGIDINPAYVEKARTIGVDAYVVGDMGVPFPDNSFDTVYLVEVVEHLDDFVLEKVLLEAKRLARRNVLITTPNLTEYDLLRRNELALGHMLDRDHKQFFTVETLQCLLHKYFSKVDVRRTSPVYPHRVLPALVRKPISLLIKLHLMKAQIYYRLCAEASD